MNRLTKHGLTICLAIAFVPFVASAGPVKSSITSETLQLTPRDSIRESGFRFGERRTVTSVSAENFRVDDITVAAIPEPSIYMLLGVGLLICGQRFLRRKRA